MTTERTPQTTQAHRTRGALLRAGRRVLERKGLHKTRVSDITKEAGVAAGTFYLHFENKDDLFRQLLITVEDEVYGELVPSRSGGSVDPAHRIRETNLLYLSSFKRNAGFWKSVEAAALGQPDLPDVLAERNRYYRSRTERAIARWQAAGEVSPDVDPATAAFVLGAMTERLAYIWYVFGHREDVDAAADDLTRLWLNYLGIG
ncbi:TetR/AcrR family transcriptional regulator [Nocardioides carbamazepini]|uniref:TetR/AcrR family transcriptional regulator n=1 Tax=Nocardioides carbamazepini TaxID=2854259 RepID=UPI002149F2CE|nr:TetR/AcrR family transcriptional regulator [Nocardioides carbamazepini]MCR1783919.1 TetR/AcrR family transcriptional regulator [Nocardioides carbamazepini]